MNPGHRLLTDRDTISLAQRKPNPTTSTLPTHTRPGGEGRWAVQKGGGGGGVRDTSVGGPAVGDRGCLRLPGGRPVRTTSPRPAGFRGCHRRVRHICWSMAQREEDYSPSRLHRVVKGGYSRRVRTARLGCREYTRPGLTFTPPKKAPPESKPIGQGGRVATARAQHAQCAHDRGKLGLFATIGNILAYTDRTTPPTMLDSLITQSRFFSS